jgi:hypothetical protein
VLGGSSGTQTVAVAGRTLTLGGTATVGGNGRLYLNGGILAGTGVYEVEGILDWLAGELAANTTLQIAEGGDCTIASGPKYSKTIGGTLYNAGTTRWGPTGSLVVNGTLHNRTNGVFEVYNDNSSISCAPTADGVIVNDGLFRRTGGSVNINFYLPVINRGTIDVTNGTFTLLEGSELHDGCAFTGAGKTLLTSETNRMHGAFYSENLNLRYSATLTGTGTVSGAMEWGGGTMDEACRLTVATNGHLTIFSEFQHGKILFGTLSNQGTVTVRSLGNLSIVGALENRPGGMVDIASDNVTIASTEGAYILNEGLIRKSGGSIGNYCYAAVTNSGTVQIQTGKLRFINGYSNPGGTILLEGGNFQSDDPLDLEPGGLLAGWGTVYNAVSNSATVRPARTNGTLTVSGDYTQTLTGKTVFELAGSTVGVDQSRLDVTGEARLAGRIEVERPMGFLPETGTNFTVMSYASHTGKFDFEDGFYCLGHDRHLESVYTSSDLTLNTIAAPDPDAGDIPFGIASDGSVLMVSWPKEFTGYDLQSKTNLNQSEWELMPGVTNCYMGYPPFLPSRFFRLTTP